MNASKNRTESRTLYRANSPYLDTLNRYASSCSVLPAVWKRTIYELPEPKLFRNSAARPNKSSPEKQHPIKRGGVNDLATPIIDVSKIQGEFLRQQKRGPPGANVHTKKLLTVCRDDKDGLIH